MKNEGNWTTRRVAGLIAFGVLLYAAAMNPDPIAKLIGWFFALLRPLLFG